VTKQLELGNVEKAVAIQQQMINGMQGHLTWQDGQLEACHRENAELRSQLEEKDRQIQELKKRLEIAERSLAEAREIMDGFTTKPSDD